MCHAVMSCDIIMTSLSHGVVQMVSVVGDGCCMKTEHVCHLHLQPVYSQATVVLVSFLLTAACKIGRRRRIVRGREGGGGNSWWSK